MVLFFFNIITTVLQSVRMVRVIHSFAAFLIRIFMALYIWNLLYMSEYKYLKLLA